MESNLTAIKGQLSRPTSVVFCFPNGSDIGVPNFISHLYFHLIIDVRLQLNI